MKKVSLNATQKGQIEAAVAAIDWQNVDWSKVGTFLMMLLQLLLAKQPKQAKAIEHCDHGECCLLTLQSALETAAKAAHCCGTCPDEVPDEEPA